MPRLYVANLPYDVQESEIRGFIDSVSKASSIKMINDRETGKFRGFAFVELEDENDVQKVIAELNDQDLGGRPIHVAVANDKPTNRDGGRNRSSAPRNGGGGNGNGRSRRGSDNDGW